MVPPGAEPALERQRDRGPRAGRHGRPGSRATRWRRAPTGWPPAAPVRRRSGFAIGSNHFMEIAKLRAARLLWARGGGGLRRRTARSASTRARPARTRRVYDRVRQPAARHHRGAVGGARRLRLAHDHALRVRRAPGRQRPAHPARGEPPRQGGRPGRRLLLHRGADRRAGGRRVGALPADRGARADGRRAGRPAPSTPRWPRRARPRRRRSPSGRRVLVGVNNYPNLLEREPDRRLATPGDGLAPRRAVRGDPPAAPSVTPRQTGRTPRVLLLERGDVKMRKARVDVLPQLLRLRRLRHRGSPTSSTDADLIVLCSADAEYLALAREVCPQVKVPVVVAGNPKDQIEALQAAGVAGFVHVAVERGRDADRVAGQARDWGSRLRSSRLRDSGLHAR